MKTHPFAQIDAESQASLDRLGKVSERFEDIKTVLVVLSTSLWMDVNALRYHIRESYPGSAVFFLNTSGLPFGPAGGSRIDLVIDFTGPDDRQGAHIAKRLKRSARFLVGRKFAFREKAYTRCVEESSLTDWLEQQCDTQKRVLLAAGVRLAQTGNPLHDVSHSLPWQLPLMQQTVGK